MVTFVATVFALAAVFVDEPARWLVLADPPQAVDAALVLSGDPDYERTKMAVRLLLAGEVRLIIVTGGAPWPGDSAESLRAVAIRAGVPAARIRMEQVSHSTRESMLAARPILEWEGVRSLAVVTSPYHQRRAVWAARRAMPGTKIISRPAEPAGWKPEGWWKTRWDRGIVVGEYLKLTYYILRGWA